MHRIPGGGKKRMTCCLSSSTHTVGKKLFVENPKGFMATQVPPRPAALIFSRPLLLVSQWKDVFGQGVHPAGLITQAQSCRSLAHCCSLPKEHRKAGAGLLEQSSALAEHTHRHSLCPPAWGSAYSSTEQDRAGVTLAAPDKHPAGCTARAHTPLLCSHGPAEPPAHSRARAGQAQRAEPSVSLLGRTELTASWEPSPGIWDISANRGHLHLVRGRIC